LLQTRNPYVWSDICSNRKLSQIERRIMDGARDAGLIDGLTIPIHGPFKGVTCISFSTHGRRIEKFDQEHMRFVGLLALSRIEQIMTLTETRSRANLPGKGLSAQEIKCLSLAWRGFSSKQIAKQTGLTHRTVDQYLAKAMYKLTARNRADAARLAMEYGFMSNI
jgi:DNA-binding CsgD family transcriptional regulator